MLDPYATCLLELRARVEALEKLHKAVVDLNERFSLDPLIARIEVLERQYETQRLATLDWGKSVDNHDRWIDDHVKRIMALEAAANNRQQDEDAELAAAPAPADSLVERVRQAQGCGNERDARAAIREVAAWLRSEYPKREGYGTAWANLLDNEADR